MSTPTIAHENHKTSNHRYTFESIDEFRRAYFPKDFTQDQNETDTVDAIGRELAKKSEVLVKSAFALQ
jgi:hypothetical protein